MNVKTILPARPCAKAPPVKIKIIFTYKNGKRRTVELPPNPKAFSLQSNHQVVKAPGLPMSHGLKVTGTHVRLDAHYGDSVPE